MKVGLDGTRVNVVVPAEFGNKPGKLDATNIVAFGELFHSVAPGWFNPSILSLRLGNVINDDFEVWLAIDQLQSDGNLSLKNQEVVNEVARGKQSKSRVEIVTQEIVIRFLLKNMPDTRKFCMAGKALNIFLNVFVDQRDPSDNSADQVSLVGHVQKGIGFFDDLPRLNRNRAGDSGCRSGDLEFG